MRKFFNKLFNFLGRMFVFLYAFVVVGSLSLFTLYELRSDYFEMTQLAAWMLVGMHYIGFMGFMELAHFINNLEDDEL